MHPLLTAVQTRYMSKYSSHPSLLAPYAYPTPHSAREPSVYQYKGGLRDLWKHTPLSVLALVSTCYKCKCGICIVSLLLSRKITRGSHLMPLVRGNSRWLLYFRLMPGLVRRGLLPVHQSFGLASKEGVEGRTMISRATRHPVSATASVM